MFTASRDAGIFPDASSGLDGREDSLHEIGLKIRGVLIATPDPDKHQVETWDYVTRNHVQQMSHGDLGFSCVGEWENLGNPLRIADFRVERQRLDAVVSRGTEVGEDQSKRGAGLSPRTRIDVEVGLAITVLVPFSDHVTTAHNERPRRPCPDSHAKSTQLGGDANAEAQT